MGKLWEICCDSMGFYGKTSTIHWFLKNNFSWIYPANVDPIKKLGRYSWYWNPIWRTANTWFSIGFLPVNFQRGWPRAMLELESFVVSFGPLVTYLWWSYIYIYIIICLCICIYMSFQYIIYCGVCKNGDAPIKPTILLRSKAVSWTYPKFLTHPVICWLNQSSG